MHQGEKNKDHIDRNLKLNIHAHSQMQSSNTSQCIKKKAIRDPVIRWPYGGFSIFYKMIVKNARFLKILFY